jgi:hypothetical protein
MEQAARSLRYREEVNFVSGAILESDRDERVPQAVPASRRGTGRQFLCPSIRGTTPFGELWKKSSYSFALSRGELMSHADQSDWLHIWKPRSVGARLFWYVQRSLRSAASSKIDVTPQLLRFPQGSTPRDRRRMPSRCSYPDVTSGRSDRSCVQAQSSPDWQSLFFNARRKDSAVKSRTGASGRPGDDDLVADPVRADSDRTRHANFRGVFVWHAAANAKSETSARETRRGPNGYALSRVIPTSTQTSCRDLRPRGGYVAPGRGAHSVWVER